MQSTRGAPPRSPPVLTSGPVSSSASAVAYVCSRERARILSAGLGDARRGESDARGLVGPAAERLGGHERAVGLGEQHGPAGTSAAASRIASAFLNVTGPANDT